MTKLEQVTKSGQQTRFNNQDAMNKNNDRGNAVPTQPFTFVVKNYDELATLDNNIDPTGRSSFGGRVPRDGDLAKTTGESINLDYEERYFIRIDGQWVNILGLCSDDDAAVQPVHGTRSSPGVSRCLAASDHRHGFPDSKTYYKKVFDERGVYSEEMVDYEDGTIFFDTVKQRHYARCNERWICFTHVE
jgi:hypothetical protein